MAARGSDSIQNADILLRGFNVRFEGTDRYIADRELMLAMNAAVVQSGSQPQM